MRPSSQRPLWLMGPRQVRRHPAQERPQVVYILDIPAAPASVPMRATSAGKILFLVGNLKVDSHEAAPLAQTGPNPKNRLLRLPRLSRLSAFASRNAAPTSRCCPLGIARLPLKANARASRARTSSWVVFMRPPSGCLQVAP